MVGGKKVVLITVLITLFLGILIYPCIAKPNNFHHTSISKNKKEPMILTSLYINGTKEAYLKYVNSGKSYPICNNDRDCIEYPEYCYDYCDLNDTYLISSYLKSSEKSYEKTLLENENPAAYFNGYINDYGLDTNNNSLYEYFIIQVGINVQQEGDYILDISIRCPGGWGQCGIVRRYDTIYLPKGNQTKELYFFGPWWRNTGVNGPYIVEKLVISDPSENLLDEFNNTYLTQPYSYMDFEDYYGRFTNKFYDYGNDTDGNGLYNYLTVVVGLNISREGSFYIMGNLEYQNNSYSHQFAHAESPSTYLTKGENNLTLNFFGGDVHKSKESGSYNLINLLLYGEGEINDYIQDDVYNTSTYNYTQFEPPPATFTGNFSDYGLDTDEDGFYNYLVIEVGLNVTEIGEYKISGSLYDNNWQYIDYMQVKEWLSEDVYMIPLKFDGTNIRSNCIDGPYNFGFISVYDSKGHLSDYISTGYTTSPYNCTDFEKLNSIKGYVFDSFGDPIFNVSVELQDEVNWYDYYNTTDANGFFQFPNLQDSLFDLDINEEPTLFNYTVMEFGDENIINLTYDLEINVTLLRINSNLKLNSLNFSNGDTVEVNVTIINKETFDLTDWLFALDIWFENETYGTDLYFNLTPMNLLAGETKSQIFVYKIPDNNTYSELYIFGGVGNENWNIKSSEGIKTALIYKGEDVIINIQESDLDNDGIPDSQDPDDDNDGINDIDDNLLGNKSNIKSNYDNVIIFVDNSTNISKIFDNIHNVQIFSNNDPLVEFYYNFSYEILNLHSVEIYKQTTTDKGSLLIIGINLPGNLTKTVYLDDLDETIDSICIKDEEILSIDEISMDCNGANEILLDCTGASFNNYTCIDIGDKYKIEGLKHSGVIELASLKSFSINLLEGWNLISIPLELPDKLVSSMLPNLTIFGYKNNSWFTPTEIENKLGYWLKINESKNLTLIGTEIENITIGLNKGWNLISYPSLNTTLVNESLKDVTYDSILTYKDNKWLSHSPTKPPYLNTLKNLTPFYGYWIKVPQNTTWTFDSTFR